MPGNTVPQVDSTTIYWTYDLTGYVFQIRNLDFAWLFTRTGWIALGVIVFGFWLFTRNILPRMCRNTRWNKLPQITETLLILVGVVFALLALLWKSGIDWGLRWYGTMYVLGGIQFYLVFLYWIRKNVIPMCPASLDRLVGYLFVGMILGARFVYVFIYNWDYFRNNPLAVVRLWEGGLSFHGGVLGVIAALILFSRRNHIQFFHLADKVVLCVPFGIAMGRLGNFLNGGELYGRVVSAGSSVPWAIIFPEGGPNPRHPSQIYQSFSEGWLLLFTLLFLARKPRAAGTLSAAFLFFYGLYRFPMEAFREPDPQLGLFANGLLSMGQILSLVAIAAGIAVFLFARKQRAPQGR